MKNGKISRFSSTRLIFLQVRQAYQRDGFAFLMKVFNEVNYLEDLTGLRAMQLATDLNEVRRENFI